MKRSISWLASLTLVCALAGTAWADAHDETTDTTDTTDDTEKKEPETKPDPTPTPTPTPTAKADAPSDDGPSLRPKAKSLGLGFGYVFPSDVQLINTVSARIVWGDKLILEPIAELSFGSDSTSIGGMDSSDSNFVFAFATEARYQMWSRRRTGLSLIGAAGVGFASDNPDGDDNNTSTLSFALSWGVGLDLWLWKDWGLSLTMTNPFFSYSSTTQQMGGGDIKNSSTFFGLVWDDTAVRFMIHAYF